MSEITSNKNSVVKPKKVHKSRQMRKTPKFKRIVDEATNIHRNNINKLKNIVDYDIRCLLNNVTEIETYIKNHPISEIIDDDLKKKQEEKNKLLTNRRNFILGFNVVLRKIFNNLKQCFHLSPIVLNKDNLVQNREVKSSEKNKNKASKDRERKLRTRENYIKKLNKQRFEFKEWIKIQRAKHCDHSDSESCIVCYLPEIQYGKEGLLASRF